MAPAPNPASEELRHRALELLVADRAALLVLQPFMALLALRLELRPVSDGRLAVAATDGQSLFFDAELALRLGCRERRHLVAHLVWHAALLHPWRRVGSDPIRWNLAIDHEVNHLLEASLGLPPGCVWFEDQAGQNAEAVYDWLAQHPSLPERGPLADLHLDPTTPPEEPRARWDPAFSPEVLRSGRARWGEHLLAAAQAMRQRGLELPPGVRHLVEALRRPLVPWRSVLAEFVVSAFGDRRQWLPPNRRFLHQSLYLPSRRHEQLRLAVALDTSASTGALQGEFWSEILGIVASYDDYEICLIAGDDRVRDVRNFGRDRPLDLRRFELRGFGGTDFRPLFAFLGAEPCEPRALVFLTDGCGQAPAFPPRYPVLWVLSGPGRVPATWGQVLRLPAPPSSRCP
jgi:predicted metal-dependent peptidase